MQVRFETVLVTAQFQISPTKQAANAARVARLAADVAVGIGTMSTILLVTSVIVTWNYTCLALVANLQQIK